MHRMWNVWAKVYYCNPARNIQRLHSFQVLGSSEAEEFADRLREYGARPLSRPQPGDSGVLVIENYVIWPGAVEEVWVDGNPEYPRYRTAFTMYDPLIHDDFED